MNTVRPPIATAMVALLKNFLIAAADFHRIQVVRFSVLDDGLDGSGADDVDIEVGVQVRCAIGERDANAHRISDGAAIAGIFIGNGRVFVIVATR